MGLYRGMTAFREQVLLLRAFDLQGDVITGTANGRGGMSPDHNPHMMHTQAHVLPVPLNLLRWSELNLGLVSGTTLEQLGRVLHKGGFSQSGPLYHHLSPKTAIPKLTYYTYSQSWTILLRVNYVQEFVHLRLVAAQQVEP